MVRYQILDVIGHLEVVPTRPQVSRSISGLVQELGMRKAMRLAVVPLQNHTTYYQAIKESHISIDAYTNGNLLISILSCKLFNEDKAIEYVQRQFGLAEFETYSFKRG